MHEDSEKDPLPPTSLNLPNHPPFSLSILKAKPPPQSPLPNQQQKVIPGYNFQSLFRKKSHIRLARKRNRQQLQKRTPSLKMEVSDKQSRNILKGHWSHQQNKLYHWFLQLHNRHFIQKHLRRTDKVFKSMASFITTRQAEQCRSHHQKMQKKYHSFHRILEKLRMDHYSTCSVDPLRADLEDHGYKLREHSLMGQNELREGEAGHLDPQEVPEGQENAERSSSQGDSQQDSMLGENYERRLNFRLQF